MEVLTRKCIICKQVKELTSDNFGNDKSRSHGKSYRCRPCDSTYGKEKYKKNPRPFRYDLMTDKQKKQKLETANKYRRTIVGRAICLWKAYQDIDEKKGRPFDITKPYLREQLVRPCVYCGDSNFLKIGLDRIDNKGGHTEDNCVPCCDECNIARSDHFTYFEMLEIGQAIKNVKEKRILSQQ